MSGPTYLRTEDGAVFELPTANVQTRVWQWVRLEDGTEVLLGPQGLTQLKPLATLRLEAGDVGNLQSGVAP